MTVLSAKMASSLLAGGGGGGVGELPVVGGRIPLQEAKLVKFSLHLRRGLPC